MPELTDEERNKLREVIQLLEPNRYRAYELRQEGATGAELRVEFPGRGRPISWANGVSLLLGNPGFEIGNQIRADRSLRFLSDRLLNAGGLDGRLLSYVQEMRDQADEALTARAYNNPGTRAWETMRARQEEDDEEETDLEEESIEDVGVTQTYQIYAWTYSGIPSAASSTVVKIGLAAAVPRSNAWRRMENSCRTTGSPGAPTMLRVWQGAGGPDSARQSESELHRSAGQRILGGGSEWFRTDLQALDTRAQALGLERHFAVNPA